MKMALASFHKERILKVEMIKFDLSMSRTKNDGNFMFIVIFLRILK